jgi:CMP-2-keto-3-deoxyoctulosonic acid synthetase
MSLNNTLLKAFIKHYNKEAIKFQGDIPCIAHILNSVIQDILKALIKNDYNTSYSKDIYKAELTNDNKEDPIEQGTSKSSFYLI